MNIEAYRITVDNGLTIVEQTEHFFKMSVHKDRPWPEGNCAFLEATLYRDEGIFVKAGSYHFEALAVDGGPVTNNVNIDIFKGAVDFFFTAILDTEYYVKSVPCGSSLCPDSRKLSSFNSGVDLLAQ